MDILKKPKVNKYKQALLSHMRRTPLIVDEFAGDISVGGCHDRLHEAT